MKFLIVDDDLAICQLLTFYLSQYARCFSATRSNEALKLFNTHIKKDPFHTIFMDIEMPGLKGHDLAELFRKAEENYQIPADKHFNLVMVSAHNDLPNVNKSFFKNQAICFIRKPFTEQSLIRELKKDGIL